MPTAVEYQSINALEGIDSISLQELKQFALDNQHDTNGNYRPVLRIVNDKLSAQNFVGLLETKSGMSLEILPKVDFCQTHEQTKAVFLNMIRCWRSLENAAQLHGGSIRALQQFSMYEVFIRMFLDNLMLLTQRGLAKHYHSVEENLPYLKGRLMFPQHIRATIANRARFYVEYDDFSANRPANRLIHATIQKLLRTARQHDNQQTLNQLRLAFVDIPLSTNHRDDWDKHAIDRSMPHYNPVMQWVGLFLFNKGLTTFRGDHLNQALLFPMEQIFEDFVAHCFRRYQSEYAVKAQCSGKHMATIDGKSVFALRPDISLRHRAAHAIPIILDTKWKRINEGNDRHSSKHGLSQADVYQLFAYGKKYGCNTVVLIYPRTENFQSTLRYQFDDTLSLLCCPFDVVHPQQSTENIIRDCHQTDTAADC